MQTMIVDTTELKSYIAHIAKTEGRVIASGYRLVYKLTKFAKDKMQQGVKPRTSRTKGKLKRSIRSVVKKSGNNIVGIAYVPIKIKYQFAAEHGFKTKKARAIHGKPMMVVEVGNWRQYKGAGKTGRLYFTVVSRGKYKGMHFTERAFDKTVKKATTELNKVGNFIIRQLVIST